MDTVPLEDRWVDNHGVRLHYLDSISSADLKLVPILFVPGAFGSTDDYHTEIAALAPRRCVVLSLRGRGKSDAPGRGYSFEDQISDIEAVVGATALDRFCLMGYSLGVAYALGYTGKHTHRLAGLILGDYPARHPAFTREWAERVRPYMPPERQYVLQAMQVEAKETQLWDHLLHLRCPVLIMRGGQEGAILKPEAAEEYLMCCHQARVVVFEASGHALWEPDVETYLTILRRFLGELDVQP